MVGGLRVTEEEFSSTESFPPAVNVWVSTMSKYDFSTGEFNITQMPDDIGATRGVVMHSLDRVGAEGVLVAFAGKSTNINNPDQNVSFCFVNYTSDNRFGD